MMVNVNTNYVKIALPVAALMLAGACSSGSPQSVTPQTTTTTASETSLPPQPSLIVGKYPDPETMAAKIKAAGVPLVADKMTYMNDSHTDVNGVGYAYGSIGTERIGFYTFDWPAKADASERQARQNGTMTYRGDGWIVSAKTAATLTKLSDILNK